MAEKEIAKYKMRQEEIFQEERARMQAKADEDKKHMGHQTSESKIEADFIQNKEKVITDLLNRILTVSLEVPKVVIADFDRDE